MNVGVAAHITAAAPGRGARRYDPSLTAEQRSGVENGIWLCGTCSIMIDRDAVRFSVETLHTLRRDHTEFARLGTTVETDVGLVAIGPTIVAGGQVVQFDATGIVVRLQFFLQGTANDLFAYVRRFEALVPLSRYVLLSQSGLGGLLVDAPKVDRDGTAWTITFQWQPDLPRWSVSGLAGISERTGQLISGEAYWKQHFEITLRRSPGTWFADMDGGSRISELYEALRGSTWFDHLVKLEIIRLASIPAPPRRGGGFSNSTPLGCVQQVLGARVPDHALIDGRLLIDVEFDLEGHGLWTGDLSLFIHSQEELELQRAKAQWMVESRRRIENGERMLPSLTPPDGWRLSDGFPE